MFIHLASPIGSQQMLTVNSI